MAKGSSKHRPGFHLVVLAIGFVVGGFMNELARRLLPPGAVKEFFDLGVKAQVGPLPVDFVIINFALGPVALDVTLLSLIGVLVAYLIARSLF